MASSTPVVAEPPVKGAPPGSYRGRWRKYGVTAAFLAPAAFFFAVWIVYPSIYTIARSFFANRGGFSDFVGLENYKALFTDDVILTAIKNNAIWVAVVPVA